MFGSWRIANRGADRLESAAALAAPLKPALVLPRASKRLTMGRSAEGEIKHACRLVSLRCEAAGVSSLG